MTLPQIHDANEDDLPGILQIHNDVVANSTAMFTDQVSSLEERGLWMISRQTDNYPVLVVRDDKGVAGYGSFGDFRSLPGYRFTVEHSIYLRGDVQGRGLGTAILEELMGRARGLGKRIMVAGIAAENELSIRFHERHGFRVTAEMPDVGYKFGRWLGLVLMQRDVGAFVKL